MPLIQLQNISYTYSKTDRPAISQLSLTISAGQKIALLGHNGCGKTTLLFLISGLFQCSAGTLLWKGEPLKYKSPHLHQWRSRIGLAFQDPEQQLVAATVAEDISYGLCNLELPTIEIERRLQQTLVDFSLIELAHTPLHHLSLGQKRRVALAGVMALQPELLLLDEPTTYLDTVQTRQFRGEIDRISSSGTTIMLATHDVNFAYTWADSILILQQGQLALFEPTQAVFSAPARLEALQISCPTLVEVWYALPDHLRGEDPHPPRSIDELRSLLQSFSKRGC